ncbi:MAG: hypothetical protein MZW92_56760 [Comamonadaceae bacterium]|nr:hypothetical protein [Comamonadaceae bacterium]
MKRADLILGAIAVGGPLAVAAAYYTQHVVEHAAVPVVRPAAHRSSSRMAAAALVGLVWRSAAGAARRRGCWRWRWPPAASRRRPWQHFVAATAAASCDLSLGRPRHRQHRARRSAGPTSSCR